MCVNVPLQLHGVGIDNAHGCLVIVVLLKGVTSGIGNEQMTFIQCDAFRFVTHFTCSDNLECAEVYLGNITFCKRDISVYCSALMTIRRYIYILAVGGKFTVIWHIFGSCYSLTLGCNELHYVAPIDGDGNQVVVHLYNVVGRVAKFLSVDISKPLVTYYLSVFKVSNLAIVCLPNPFVKQDNFLLCISRANGTNQCDNYK